MPSSLQQIRDNRLARADLENKLIEKEKVLAERDKQICFLNDTLKTVIARLGVQEQLMINVNKLMINNQRNDQEIPQKVQNVSDASDYEERV